MLQRIVLLIFVMSPLMGYSQIGGQHSYEFVNIPANPRLTGLGGVNVSLANEDVNFGLSNPALNGDTLSGNVSFSYLNYFADASIVSTAYQHDFGKYGAWFFGVTHLGYGDIDSYDDTGASLGIYSANETLVIIGRSHRVSNFSIGGSLKFINSNLAGYSSSALAVDLGGVFIHPDRQLTIGLALKNMGFVLSDYTTSSDSKLPFDVQLGITFKPEHMPLRFSLTGYNLSKGDITYFNVNDVNGTDKTSDFDNVLRHVNIGAELLLSKNINVRFGYNHLVRQELKLAETSGGAGISYGLMFKIKAFEFAYSRGGYHAAGGSNNFSVTANTNMFLKRRNKL